MSRYFADASGTEMDDARGENPFYDDVPDGHVLCPRCNGYQTVSCRCGGDLCVCENYGEEACPMCGGEYGGEGYVPKERAERYWARQAEFAAALKAAMGEG